MKRLASLLLVAVLVVSMVPASLLTALAADVTTISPALQDEAVPVFTGDAEGDTFAVDFNLELADGLEAIAGYEVEITWDSSVLAYDSLETFGSGIVVKEEGESSVRLAVANATDALSGRLFAVVFTALAAGDAEVSVEVLSIATASGLIEAEGGSLEFSIVDGRPTNLAAGKAWTGSTDAVSDYKGDITDGKYDTVGKYDKTLWLGFDNRKTSDHTATIVIDLGANYTNIHEVRAFVWPAGKSGIVVPAEYKFYASNDGKEYTELGTVAGVASDPTWIGTSLEETVTARYIKLVIVGTEENSFWFIGELEVNAYNPEIVEEPEIETSVSVEVLEGSVKIPAEDVLAKLFDGNDAAGATAFSDAGLVGFENTGFVHTDGVDAAVPATIAITVDMGEVKVLAKTALSAYKESNSMIALPSLKFEVSVDGVNFYDVNAGGTVAPKDDLAESATATLTADFSIRAAVNARYVRVIASFQNGWLFLSEVGVTTTEAYTGVDPNVAYPYADAVSGTAMGVYDAEDGTLDLAAKFKNSQLIKAVYDEEAGAYKIIYSKVNPWPAGQSGYETMGDHEILVAINTGGNLVAEVDDAAVITNLFSGCKWIARGLTEGDYLVFDAEAGTVSFYPAEGEFEAGDLITTVKEPVEPQDPVAGEGNLVAGLEWTGDTNAGTAYVGDVTDGLISDDASYNKELWYGFDNRLLDDNVATMIFDMVELYNNIENVRLYVWPLGTSGIAVPGSYTVYGSADGVTYTELGVITDVEAGASRWIELNFEELVTARFIKIDITGEAGPFWFVGEVEVNAKAADTPVDPEPVPNTKVEVNVNDNAILTDGKTGFDGNWGAVGGSDVVLVANSGCTEAGMDVTLLYALGEAKKIDSVTIDLYHCAGVMIGYPEGQAIVLISTDGETYTEVGAFDLAAADVAVGSYGTVSSTFEFDAVEAAYVKVLLYAGSNEAVLGDSPADGKIFWEFISVAEFAVGEYIPPVVEEHSITISHVNAYNWECYYEMVVVGEGKVATDIYNGNYTNWIAFKVENIDEIYTVTAIEGKGVAKTLVAPADGFLVYCASNDAASFAAAGLVEVGDVLLSCDFNWRQSGASATPKGTMVFGPKPSADHDHNYTSKVTKEPTLAAEGEMLYVCVCGERYTEAIPAVKAQPDELVELPEGAYTLDYAGYKHAGVFSIVVGSNLTVEELTALGNDGAAKDMNYAYIVVVDANGKVVDTWFELAVSKAEVVCPAGGYIISYNGNKEGYDALADIEVGCTISLYNVDLDAIDGVAGNVELTDAGFTVVRPEADVVIDVNENELLTDGNTGYTEGWGSTSGKVVLAQNPYCTTVGMNVTLLYALEETKKIESVTVDFYFDKNVMIGYPEGTATVLVSTDGETYTKVGTFDLAEADLSAPGTVSNLFKFEGVDAAFVKVELFVGSNEAVLGDSPADGKIFWEFISVAEFAVAEAPVNLAEGKGWTGDTNIGSSYVGDITDGKIDPNRWGAYDTTVWYGFDQRNSGDSIGTMIIDLGAVYTNLAHIRAYVWPAGASGIAVPKSYDFYISEDGVTYTLVTSVAGEKNDPVWVYTDNTDVLTARYIKLDIVGSSYDTFWFIGEIEVNSYDPQIVDDDPIEPPVENTKVEVNVNDNAILTDGKTGFDGAWGTVGTGDVVLVANNNCQKAGMDVTLLYALGETKKIDSITLDLYYDKNVMIGYPEGQAIVLISTDGETYTELGKFDLTAADFSVTGTISNVFEFEAVEAAYVKVLLYAGSNAAVLGDSPADGKIFWEFISVAEFAVGEVEEAPTYAFGDVNGDGKVNTADYVVLKRHIMNTYELNEDQLTRANINGDTKINTADYVLLKRFIMGTWEPN